MKAASNKSWLHKPPHPCRNVRGAVCRSPSIRARRLAPSAHLRAFSIKKVKLIMVEITRRVTTHTVPPFPKILT